MNFDYPVALLALAFVPLAGLIYLAAQRRRRKFAVRFTNVDLLADVVTAHAELAPPHPSASLHARARGARDRDRAAATRRSTSPSARRP